MDNPALHSHQLPKLLALKHLPNLRTHMIELRVHGNDVIDDIGAGHRSSHLLEYTRVIHQRWHLYDDIRFYQPIMREHTIFGSLGFTPSSANGLMPAIAPNPRWLLSCVRGSCIFCPACIVGICCGDEDDEEDGCWRTCPLTMWIVWPDCTLYTESCSSS